MNIGRGLIIDEVVLDGTLWRSPLSNFLCGANPQRTQKIHSLSGAVVLFGCDIRDKT